MGRRHVKYLIAVRALWQGGLLACPIVKMDYCPCLRIYADRPDKWRCFAMNYLSRFNDLLLAEKRKVRARLDSPLLQRDASKCGKRPVGVSGKSDAEPSLDWYAAKRFDDAPEPFSRDESPHRVYRRPKVCRGVLIALCAAQ
jgi:hypothetical protein